MKKTPNFKYIHDLFHHFPIIEKSVVSNQSLNLSLNHKYSIHSNHILFVLAHGLSGNEFDMNRIKSFINSYMHAEFLLLTNIKSDEGHSIVELGNRAA